MNEEDATEKIRMLLESFGGVMIRGKDLKTGEGMEKLTRQIMSKMAGRIFFEKIMASTGAKDEKEARSRVQQVEIRYKESAVSALIDGLEEQHLHEPFMVLRTKENNCSGPTRYLVMAAYTDDDWELMMKNFHKAVQASPSLGTAKEFEERLHEKREKRDIEVDELLKSKEPVDPSFKIPVK